VTHGGGGGGGGGGGDRPVAYCVYPGRQIQSCTDNFLGEEVGAVAGSAAEAFA